MDFKIGYNVKPKNIINDRVIFEKYTGKGVLSDVTPTKEECEAYGFNWTIDNRCWSAVDNRILIELNHVIDAGTSNTKELGVNNSLIAGNNNTIKWGVNGTFISGTKGEANYHNSQVLAGNQSDDLETRQSIIVLAGEETTSSAWGKARLNNDGSSVFNIKDNSIITFNFYITAVRTGGTAAGSKGDFKSWVERGTAVNRAGTTTLKRVRTNIGNDGTTTGWNTLSAVNAANDLNISIKGATNMDIKWIVKLELIEMRTGVDLS